MYNAAQYMREIKLDKLCLGEYGVSGLVNLRFYCESLLSIISERHKPIGKNQPY